MFGKYHTHRADATATSPIPWGPILVSLGDAMVVFSATPTPAQYVFTDLEVT
jgi:hypothetical protein